MTKFKNTFLLLPAVYLCCLCSSFHICGQSLPGKELKPEVIRELSQKAVFLYLSQGDKIADLFKGTGLTKIDPILRTRDTIWMKGDFCFIDAMYNDELAYPLQKSILHLAIPDSLSNKYKYTEPGANNDLDFSATIYLFSPLLPTKNPAVFLMERYVWISNCSEGSCARGMFRGYLRFEVQSQQVIFMEEVDQGEDANDFCGFGLDEKEMKGGH